MRSGRPTALRAFCHADHAGGSGQPAELDFAERREDVQPQEVFVEASWDVVSR